MSTWQTLRAVLLVVASAQEQRLDNPYTLVADAGSTGTRMYMYNVPQGATDPSEPAVDIAVLGKGPALSSFQDHPQGAASAVQKQIQDAKQAIPERYHKTVPLMIFATAGMRLVELSKAQAVYEGLRSGLLGNDYKFDESALLAKTISGREEGVYAFLAANFLSKRIDVGLQLRGHDLMGVMDLGGSSTQIAIPPLRQAKRPLLHSLSGETMYVKSFLSLGMERMRQLTYKTILDKSDQITREVRKVPNPCAFSGHSEGEEHWHGTGDSRQCQHIIATILKNETEVCRSGVTSKSSCLPLRLPEHVQTELADNTPHFFLISGYVFVVDFAQWWLNQHGVVPKRLGGSFDNGLLSAMAKSETFVRPTIKELRAAAAILCAGPWVNVSNMAFNAATAHKRTPPQKVAHRCFELNYIISLLSVGYGFPDDKRAFHFVDTIAGQEVEWTLGAYLFSRSTNGQSISLAENGEAGFPGGSDEAVDNLHDVVNSSNGSVGTLVLMLIALLIGISIAAFLKRLCNKPVVSESMFSEVGKAA